jgi:hypothetical protein
MGQGTPLTTETDSEHHCEGRVITCARCGRPLTECDGGCEPVLETRGHRVATAEDLDRVRALVPVS